MIYEVRNYHFRPDLLAEYREWARTRAVPFLATRMDVLGFWVNGAEPCEVAGEPLDALGSANVTWIIRWDDMAHRNRDLTATLESPEWAAIFAHVPGGRASYLRIESKFAQSLL